MNVDHGQALLPMTGIILAGGKSSRMRRNKAFIEWNGVPLIERSLSIFNSIFSEVIISSNQPELYAKYGVKVVKDSYLDQGPLGGLEACLREANYDYSFFAACDMPFLSPEVIRFMAENIDQEDILVPEVDGGLHPLHAFYHKNCLPIFEKSLNEKKLKMVKLIRDCKEGYFDVGYKVSYIKEEDFKEFPNIRLVFSNMNTPEECLSLQQKFCTDLEK